MTETGPATGTGAQDSTWQQGATGMVTVGTQRTYPVAVGAGLLCRLPNLLRELKPSRIAVVTDSNVAKLYPDRPDLAQIEGLDQSDGTAPSRYVVAAGEQSKRFGVLEGLLDFLVQENLDRRSVLVAFGGGVIGDLTGLAAALFMRGIDVVQCPTTLLAMVDSSVGGKTAVNLTKGKNLAGSFHQPVAVLADTELLATLSRAELNSGLGEVIKTALVGDPELLEWLHRKTEAVLACEPVAMNELVTRSVAVKSAVVTADERESGQRKTLNLGHTFAHAIELVAGFGTIPHGVAVGTGLALAARASESTGLLIDKTLPTTVESLLESVSIPSSLGELRSSSCQDLPAEALIEALRHDKKGGAGEPAFVLPRAAGQLLVDQKLEPALLQQLLG